MRTEVSDLGAVLVPDGCLFRLFAPRAELVELVLIHANRNQINYDMTRSDEGVWSITVPEVQAGQRYGFRCHGPWDPQKGFRFNPAKLLVDPYAKAITSGVDYAGPILDHVASSIMEPDSRDSAKYVPLSVVVPQTPIPTPIAKRLPLEDSIIYELHVKGFTQTHPAVPEHLRGTYAGLAYPNVINYLKDLGVTAIELLPVHHFVSEPFVVSKGRTNYWGYNTLAYFAPHGPYSSTGTIGQQVAEFKSMVSAFHKAGIEVILDVVYNHTAEGGHFGPTLCWRGIDHAGYYRLTNDKLRDYDVTGCGNSLDTSHDFVMQMVLDSMHYWVTEMGVDGFRFDLATTLIRDGDHHVDQNHPIKAAIANNPVFKDIKMIAEPWDIGPFGYQVGNWGEGWSEWNDKYRDCVRNYWRGGVKDVKELATRLSGSSDLFNKGNRTVGASINYVTCHDGFTMRDLVSYDIKHNENNGESNRDGSDNNLSWNCGWEGDTEDPEILALRKRQIKNFMATLLVSAGTPMLLAGDEVGRTQQGNNNAYCRDSPVSWINWNEQERWDDIYEIVKELIQLRKEHPVFRPKAFRHASRVTDDEGNSLGRPDLAWLNGNNGAMNNGDWDEPSRRHLGMYISAPDEAFIVWFNGSSRAVEITLPGLPWGTGYEILLHTADDDELPDTTYLSGELLSLPPRSVIIMEAVIPVTAAERLALERAESEIAHNLSKSNLEV